MNWGPPALVLAALLVVAACGGGGGGGDEDPSRWRLDYVSASRDSNVFAVVPVSRDEGWAILSETRKDGEDDNVLLHRSGGAWRRAAMPTPLLSAYYGADLAAGRLRASGPDNVWLFAELGSDDSGIAGNPGAARWDGRQWQRTSVDFGVRDVAVLAPDDVWALDASTDDTVARHWDGRRWTGHKLPIPYAGLLAASGPADVWAVGQRDDHRKDPVAQPAAVHFDGKSWRPVPMPEYREPAPKPEEKTTVDAIVALSPTDAWAFGSHDYTDAPGSPGHSTPFALHWDGSQWRSVPNAFGGAAKFPAQSLVSAAGDGAGGFVVGSLRGTEQQRAADGTLRLIKDPKPVAGRSGKITERDRRLQEFQVHDLRLVPGTRQVWAAGAVGVSLLASLGKERYARGAIASYSTGG